MNMKKTLLVMAMAATAPSVLALPLIDVEAGLGMNFNTLNSGAIGSDVSLTGSGGDVVNLDLTAANGLYVSGRLGLPVLPDVKVRYESMKLSNDNVTGTVEFFGESFTINGEAELDMSHLDTALAFSLKMFPFVDYIDLGLNARWMLGGFTADVAGETKEQAFEASGVRLFIPTLHLAGAVSIPVVDAQISGAINTLPFEGASMNDWHIKARYYAPLPINMLAKVGVEAGYRKWTIDIDGSKAAFMPEEAVLNFDVSGLFVGAAISF